MSRTLFITVALAAFVFPVCAQTPQIAPVANPPQLKPLSFSIGGRVLPTPVSDPRFGARTVTYQWPGTYFEAAFAGPEVCFAIGPSDEILQVILGNQPPMPLAKPAPGVQCASGLADTPHSVRVDVVTESQDG